MTPAKTTLVIVRTALITLMNVLQDVQPTGSVMVNAMVTVIMKPVKTTVVIVIIKNMAKVAQLNVPLDVQATGSVIIIVMMPV